MSGLWNVTPAITAPKEGLWLGTHSAGRNALRLGSLAELSKASTPSVWMSTEKEHTAAILGKRGSGKSFTLGVIAEGLCLSGPAEHTVLSSKPRAAILFDPLDLYWTTRFPVTDSDNPEAKKLLKLAKAEKLDGLKFNVSAWVPGQANRRPTDPEWFRTLTLAPSALSIDEWEALLEVSVLSDPIGQALIDCIETARTFPNQPFGMADIIRAVDTPQIQQTFHAETLRALRQRLAALNRSGLFSPDGTPIRDLITAGNLSVILLSRLPSSYRAAVVAVIVRMIMDVRSSVAFAEKRAALDPTLVAADKTRIGEALTQGIPKTTILLDEAQIFLAPDSPKSIRQAFIRLVKEGRNFGLSAVIATQQPSAIDQRILSQIETLISHQLVTESDIRAVRDNLKSEMPSGMRYGASEYDVAGVLRALEPGQALISSADSNFSPRRCFIARIRPRATIHGGIEL